MNSNALNTLVDTVQEMVRALRSGVPIPSLTVAQAEGAARLVAMALVKETPVTKNPAPVNVRRRYDRVPDARLVWPWFEQTPDGELVSMGISLRVKNGDGDPVQLTIVSDDRECLVNDLRLAATLLEKYEPGAHAIELSPADLQLLAGWV